MRSSFTLGDLNPMYSQQQQNHSTPQLEYKKWNRSSYQTNVDD